ncbi:MAG: dihydrofolate reductase family protein, partial [Chloroflexota bacterium]|nr:dihydrofolate reductase family protein [Chloroflexota bacterium]
MTQPDQRALPPLDTLFDAAPGDAAPLPPTLATLYGRLAFPAVGRPWIISNFVASIDGVVAYNDPIPPGQGEISASNPHDRAVMGLLRAMADAVIVGAGTLRSVPRHLWTPSYIYPPLAAEYAALRSALGKSSAPLTVIVSASGDVDTALPVFQQAEASALLLTTPEGAARLAGYALGPRARVVAAAADEGVGGLAAATVRALTVAALAEGADAA